MSPIRILSDRRPPLGPILLLAALGAVAGCGGEQGPGVAGGGAADPSQEAPSAAPDGSSAASSAHAEPAAAERPHFDELPVLFPEREQRQPKGVRFHMRRADAAKAGWTTEVFADAAEPELERFLERLLTDANGLAAGLDDTWQGTTSLVPRRLEVDFDAGGLSILRGVELDPALRPVGDLVAVAAELVERYVAGGADGEGAVTGSALAAGEVDVDVDLVGVEVDGVRYGTRARVQLARRGPLPVQHNLELAADWRVEDPERPRLSELRLEAFEEVRAAAPLFAELTEHAFGATPNYREHILRGVDAYLGRTDRAAGFSFQGMQGLAVGDANGDGIDDIYLCQQVGLPNQLLLGGVDGRYTDVGRRAHVDFIDLTRAALFLDWDNDGDQDLVLALGAFVYLCLNEGEGVFGRPSRFAADGGAHFYNLSAADADGDGDLDLYAGRYSAAGVMRGAPAPYHDAGNGASSYFLRNDGPEEMVDATEESGLGVNNSRFTLASIWDDFDDDGDLDLYVVNDFGSNNLFQNDGTGHFVDVAGDSGAVDIGAGMGASAADYDLDGDVDLYVTNMWSAPGMRIVQQSEMFLEGQGKDLHRWYTKHASGNTLLANRGDGTFEDVTRAVGGALGRWAWGGEFVDFDNDAYHDLYVPCGQTTKEGASEDLESFFWRGVISQTPLDAGDKPLYQDAFTAIHHLLLHRDYHWNGLERNVAYQNIGGGRFADVSVATAADFLADGRAVALLDWDADGRQDMLVKSRTAPRLRLMHNRSRSGYASVSFDLTGVTCNRDAIGARVVLEVDGKRLAKRIYAGDGYLSQSSKRLHFGVGSAEHIDKATVEWPDGERDEYAGLAVGAVYRIVQGASEPVVASRPQWSLDPANLPGDTPQPNTEPVTRVPLFEVLPMRPFPLPSAEDPARYVDSFRGSTLVVHLWTASHPSGEAGLAQLARSRTLAGDVDVRIVALSVDEGPYLARARKLAAAGGFEPGYADGRTLAAYEVVAFEVLDVFDDIPLPLTLVIDRAGRLMVLYCGLFQGEELARDIELVSSRDDASLIELRGGYQALPRKRRLSRMAAVFETQGAVGIAEYFRALIDPSDPEDE